ncbi:VWA domain-containing protein [Ichthyenterobacterium sp. W332]|uniref:VWA domain-containing protein n=1 Tax=Microcosmobacter mediterraneus TaxID=3075607 RepID=A0ABU2YKI0_9FLAO|nr:VWA domain-containing protein [Ichthyenterobacterium sp. W332]MDT0558681.1 VWA domain-containing protein [Ichthyenterobacterium sp. W332]
MSSTTIVYIILAGILALLVALFQYKPKGKFIHKNIFILALLRFISVFALLVLLINPKFEKRSYFNEKPNLVIAVDNSESIAYLDQDENVKSLLESITNNPEIQERFNVEQFSFGNSVQQLDTLSFKDSQSDLNLVFERFKEVYESSITPIVFITDGNQTYGNDYEFSASKFKQPIFPVILGDTITYADLKLQKLNVNKYAYLKNQFPVEAIVVYNGTESVSTTFKVNIGNSIVFSKNLNFSKTNSSQVISFNLPANRVGVKTFRAVVEPLSTEKNTINNAKSFAVEVIDQQTNVALVSDITHPDLGALKSAIERNEQRKVRIIKPTEYLSKIYDYQLVILYQPNNKFRSVIQEIQAKKLNSFLVAGAKTNWALLNALQANYNYKITNQVEDFQANLNRNYSSFIVEDIGFDNFPPLKGNFGEVTFNLPIETILYKTVNGIETTEPLLATYETNGIREAILLGEHLWKWRAQSYLSKNDFNEFDDFIGKLVQYLGSDFRRNRLNIDYESFYNGNDNVIISAQYFNKNYEFDGDKNLTITLKNIDNNSTIQFPFILKSNSYEVDISGIKAGDYQFTVSVNGENISRSSSIKILDYNVEQQFLNADVTKLQRLATNSNGKAFFNTESQELIDVLLQDNRFAIIQKSTKNIVPLIDFKYLLALIALSLAIEWFMRKYKGLI